MTDFGSDLANKLGQQPAVQSRPNGAAKPLTVPVEVREQSRKPQRLKVVTTRGVGKNGKPFVIMTPAPGFVIARVIFTEMDATTRKAKCAVICESRRGRPHNSQRRENGATERD